MIDRRLFSSCCLCESGPGLAGLELAGEADPPPYPRPPESEFAFSQDPQVLLGFSMFQEARVYIITSRRLAGENSDMERGPLNLIFVLILFMNLLTLEF